jgi:hypothetical protein
MDDENEDESKARFGQQFERVVRGLDIAARIPEFDLSNVDALVSPLPFLNPPFLMYVASVKSYSLKRNRLTVELAEVRMYDVQADLWRKVDMPRLVITLSANVFLLLSSSGSSMFYDPASNLSVWLKRSKVH